MKPILGCEVYIASPARAFEKEKRERDESGFDAINHLLAARDERARATGTSIYLVSKGYLEGFYYKPRIDRDLLRVPQRGADR